jgi:hypothetical protein
MLRWVRGHTDHEGLAVLRETVLQQEGQGGVAEGDVLLLLGLFSKGTMSRGQSLSRGEAGGGGEEGGHAPWRR